MTPKETPPIRLHRDGVYCAVIVALVWMVYFQVHSFDFLTYDDRTMVFGNPRVLSGLRWDNVQWGFSHGLLGIWMPFTILTYLLDAEWYGDWAGGYHLTNVAIHTLNALILYFALRALTRQPSRSFFVALLFAVHPLRAESVAWIAERKDLTCGFFWCLAMLAYARYAQRPAVAGYVLVFLAMAFGVMSKTMIITLPCVLLLLDWWPLERIFTRTPGFPCTGKTFTGGPLLKSPFEGRFRGMFLRGKQPECAGIQHPPVVPLQRGTEDVEFPGRTALKLHDGWLMVEKLPLFLLSLAAAWLVVYTQKDVSAYTNLDILPLRYRLANVPVAYVRYLAHFFAPVRLSVLYPHPGAEIAWGQVACSAVLLAVVTGVVVWRHDKRYLAVGWFWYLGTLAPVIGLVQVGNAAIADRYTYLPMIGAAIMLAWGVPDLLTAIFPKRESFRRIALTCGASLVILLLTATAWWQAGFWRNTETLFKRALAVTQNNDMANTILATALYDQGRVEEAIPYYREALRIRPNYAEWHYNLGSVMLDQGQYADAARLLRRAVEIDPRHAPAQTNLGVALLRLNRKEEALIYLAEGVRLAPSDVNAHINYGVVLLNLDRKAEAVNQFAQALALDPKNVAARANLESAQRNHAGVETTR